MDITTATRNGETASDAMENEPAAEEMMENESTSAEVFENSTTERAEENSPLEGTDISVSDVPAEMEAAEAQHQIDASVGATEPEVAPEGFPEEPKQPNLITVNEEKEKPFWGGFFGRP